MLGLCFAPLLLLGMNTTIQTGWHHSEHITAPFIEVQTCKTGLGAHVAAGTHPWVTGGLHYGFTWQIDEKWSVTLQPKAGLSYSNTIHPENHYRQITRFELGLELITCRDYICGMVGYRHMSNGRGDVQTNQGVDFLELGLGYQFN